jgi:hypothetical protein
MSTAEVIQITKQDLIDTVASELFELVNEEDRIADLLKEKRAEFLDLVGPGYRGAFEPHGEISTTMASEDRLGEGMQLVFDPAIYPTLPVTLRAQLEKLGFAKLEPKTIKGQPSKVVVKRRKK